MQRLFSSLLITLLAVSVLSAADFWIAKPYSQWSKSQAARLLVDSPWARTITLRSASISQNSRTGNQRIGDTDADPAINYVVCLRSAKAIRQARVRLNALEQKYDKMDVSAREAFDAQSKDYLAQTFPDVIVVSIAYTSNVPIMENQLALFFQAQTIETMKGTVRLAFSDGRVVQPSMFKAGQGAAHEVQFIFERPQELPPNASFTMEFSHPGIAGQPIRRLSAKFNTKEMVYDGVTDY